MRTGENIYKRKDGRWEARVFIGYRPNGRTSPSLEVNTIFFRNKFYIKTLGSALK